MASRAAVAAGATVAVAVGVGAAVALSLPRCPGQTRHIDGPTTVTTGPIGLSESWRGYAGAVPANPNENVAAGIFRNRIGSWVFLDVSTGVGTGIATTVPELAERVRAAGFSPAALEWYRCLEAQARSTLASRGCDPTRGTVRWQEVSQGASFWWLGYEFGVDPLAGQARFILAWSNGLWSFRDASVGGPWLAQATSLSALRTAMNALLASRSVTPYVLDWFRCLSAEAARDPAFGGA